MKGLQIKVGAYKEFLYAGKSISSFPSSVFMSSCLHVCLSVFVSVTLSLACMSPAVVLFSSSVWINFFPSHYFSHPRCLFQFIPLHLFIISFSLLILSTFPPPLLPQDRDPPLHSRACLTDRRSLSILPCPLTISSS